MTARAELADLEEFEGRCNTCGYVGVFRQTQHRVRETFSCEECRSSLRYQVQADALVQTITGRRDISLREAVEKGLLASLRIYEAGVSGPFRKFLEKTHGYTKSFFWPDVEPGTSRDNVICQNLMNLTFPDNSFDVVVTSDIFEHIRHPDLAFAEIRRILAPGGKHVFTVPTNVPFSRPTLKRVDVSGPEDVHILPPAYHGDGQGGKSLVYNEYGSDMIELINQCGMSTAIFHHRAGGNIGSRCLAFVAKVPAGEGA
jgi:SAM-dependent methyltransferase